MMDNKSNKHVQYLLQNTYVVWKSGYLNGWREDFKNEAEQGGLNGIKHSCAGDYPIIKKLLDDFVPLRGEYITGLGEVDSLNPVYWFLSTNYRFLIRDGESQEYKIVPFHKIAEYTIEEKGKEATLHFALKDGLTITCEKVVSFPKSEFAQFLLSLKDWEQLTDYERELLCLSRNEAEGRFPDYKNYVAHYIKPSQVISSKFEKGL